MEDYQHIVIVKKLDLEAGTKVQRVETELFGDEKKRKFNMVRFFNPDRNELFFARKVVLVEGPTEKAVLPLFGRRIGCFDHKISIIDCASKFNLTLFVDVLNAFRIQYIVIHDEDPMDPEIKPGGSKYDPDKFREAKQAFEENEKISNGVDLTIGKVIKIPEEFEKLLGISRTQAEKLGKPFAAIEKYARENIEISDEIKKLVREVYG